MDAKIYICRGKNCTRQARNWDALDEVLDGVAEIEIVDCQKICRPPVVGTEVDGRLEWFAEVDTAKSRRRLVELLAGRRLRKALKKRRVKKRRDQLR